MTHPCPGAPPGQDSRWREWGTKVSGMALIPTNCSVPGGKRRSPSPHFAFIPGSKQDEQTAWLLDPKAGRESPAWLTQNTPAWTADIPPLQGIHSGELTHPQPFSPPPQSLGLLCPHTPPSPFGSTPDWTCSLVSGVWKFPPDHQRPIGWGRGAEMLTSPMSISGGGDSPSPGSLDRASKCLRLG